jgi:hypothetical protein
VQSLEKNLKGDEAADLHIIGAKPSEAPEGWRSQWSDHTGVTENWNWNWNVYSLVVAHTKWNHNRVHLTLMWQLQQEPNIA